MRLTLGLSIAATLGCDAPTARPEPSSEAEAAAAIEEAAEGVVESRSAQSVDTEPAVERKPISAASEADPAVAAAPDFESLRSVSPVVDRALELRSRVRVDNSSDIYVLLGHMRGLLRGLDAAEREALPGQIVARFEADAARLRLVENYYRNGPGAKRWWEGIDLRKAIEQLLGTPSDAAGIYRDARELLHRSADANPLNPDAESVVIEPYQSAGLKTLLLYAAVVLEGRGNVGELGVFPELHLVYPVAIDERLPPEHLADAVLMDRTGEAPRFLIPNAGFVMGGAFQKGTLTGGKYRGVDCSAFASYCAGCPRRLSTWVMEFCWRELVHGKDDFSKTEKPFRKEFLKLWGLREALEHFEAIEFEGVDDLRAGDLLVRRWTPDDGGRRVGNTTIFLQPIDDTRVWGVECNRLYDPVSGERFDGIVYREYDLSAVDVTLYVLRPRGGR